MTCYGRVMETSTKYKTFKLFRSLGPVGFFLIFFEKSILPRLYLFDPKIQ